MRLSWGIMLFSVSVCVGLSGCGGGSDEETSPLMSNPSYFAGEPDDEVGNDEDDRERVSSTAMRSVGYDESQHVLTIEFPNGAVYEYRGVAPDIHDDLMRSSSHGRYFQRNVRNEGYEARRIR